MLEVSGEKRRDTISNTNNVNNIENMENRNTDNITSTKTSMSTSNMEKQTA